MRKKKVGASIFEGFLKVLLYLISLSAIILCFLFSIFRVSIEISLPILSFLFGNAAIILSMWYRQKDLLKEECQKPIEKAMKKGKTLYAVIISTDDTDKEKKKAQWIQLPK